MKKLSFLMIAALFMAACSNNDELLNNENLNGKVTVTATLPSDAPDSRVALTEDNTNPEEPTIKVSWEETESFSVIRGSENVTYSKSTEGNAFTGEAHATTDGTYYAFYPANESATATDALPYDLSVQTGALAAEKTYMFAKNETDGKNYEFSHLTALVKFTLALPDGVTGVTPSKVVISSDKLKPVGTVDLTGVDVTYTASEDAATSITITPTSLEFYAYVTPMSASDSEKNTFVISMDGSDGKYYSGTLETSKSIAANYLYTANVNMICVAKGSLAMKNGSFKNLTATEINALSASEKTALKNEVAGIVFWTVNDEGSSTLVGDAAADKIMQTDFPNCTHGLIVALTNVSESCLWQNSGKYESVYTNFQNTGNFNPGNKSDYKSIASQFNGTDNNNYILGYQNTKVLEAYNDYCSETTGKENYKVNPVSALATWKTTTGNESPANTTGWFIPSAKELHMLYHKDDLYDSYGSETFLVIDPLIEALDGKKLSNYFYWSSLEYAGNYAEAFYVTFGGGSVVYSSKGSKLYVRAVCAY